MKEKLIALYELREKERAIKEERSILEEEIYNEYSKVIDNDRTFTLNLDGVKLSIKPNFAVKVNQELAANNPSAFKVKYEMSYSQYTKSEVNVDEYVTITQNKPTFTVSF